LRFQGLGGVARWLGRLIRGLRVTTSWVRRPLWVNQLGQLSLPSLRGRQMSNDVGNCIGYDH